MSDSRDATVQLLPHQSAFIDNFFNPASKRVLLLRADAGLGKATTFVALVKRLLQERPSARVLLLAPLVALRVQFVDQLLNGGVPALSVDRYQFREMLDAATAPELWPSGVVSVLSRDFARQEDIGRSLSATHWDLLIVDEAQQFQGSLSADLLGRVAEVSDRVILTTVTSLGPDLLGVFPEGCIAVVQWRRNQIVDFSGGRLDTMPGPMIRLVHFTLSPAEVRLAETVAELARLFNAGTTQQDFIGRSLLRSRRSSPVALERSLERIRMARDRAVHAIAPMGASSEDESLDDGQGGYPDPVVMVEAASIASRALDALESSGGDSKLTTLVTILDHINAEKPSRARVCILTDYVATLFYLAAEIESRGLKCHSFHGGTPADERQQTLSAFATDGGVLLATRAVMSGYVPLGEVTDLVFYDVPASPDSLQSVLARVDRFGRRTQLTIHALVPSGDVSGGETDFIGLLRQMTEDHQ